MAQGERRQVPEVRRPRGVAWRSLQADGLVWEGQVFLVGADFDMAARLIVTRERLALARGGGIILEAPREWFRPAPRLLPDGNVLLTVTPDADAGKGDSETLLLRMREGWSDASHLVTLLGGSRSRRRASRPAGAGSATPVPVIPVDPDDPLNWARPGGGPTEASAGAPGPTDETPRQDPPWSRSRRGQPPIDVPVAVPAATEAGATVATAKHEPYVLPPPKAPASHGRYYDWNLPPEEVVPSRGNRRRRGWILRLSGLFALILVAVAVAALADDRGSGDRTLEGARITGPAGVGGVADAATETPTGSASDLVTATADPSIASGPGDRNDSLPQAVNEQTAVALGVGSDLSPTATTAPVEAPPALPTDAIPTPTRPLDEATTAVEDSQAEPATQTLTPAPPTETEVPTAAPTASATETATTVPTRAALAMATIATATATPEATATAPPTATAVPATATPGPTAEPTPPPATATAEPPTATLEPVATETPAPTAPPAFPTQVASVAEAGYTAPAFEAGALRLTVESTMKGSSLPSLGLGANPYGDWLVAVVYVYNWSDAAATLAMPDFGLITADPAVSFMPLDSGTGLIGSTLGFQLPLDSTDVVTFLPGEGHRIGLLFTAEPLGSGFSLQYGTAIVGIQSSLAASPNVPELGAPPADPDLLEATVTGVIDGDTITVERDGVEAAVTYIGVRAPDPDACYGPEATAANGAIVAPGDTVYLEREVTNENDDGALPRDVWIDLDGASVLVANELAAAGAVNIRPDSVNVRFLSWLEVTVANAAFQGLGLWGACGGEVGDGSGGAAAAVPASAFALLPRPPALTGEG